MFPQKWFLYNQLQWLNEKVQKLFRHFPVTMNNDALSARVVFDFG